jgi:hypothetical protein
MKDDAIDKESNHYPNKKESEGVEGRLPGKER